MMEYTAEKDGQYISSVRVDNGPNIANKITRFNPTEGWVEVFDGISKKKRIIKGVVTFVDERTISQGMQSIRNKRYGR